MQDPQETSKLVLYKQGHHRACWGARMPQGLGLREFQTGWAPPGCEGGSEKGQEPRLAGVLCRGSLPRVRWRTGWEPGRAGFKSRLADCDKHGTLHTSVPHCPTRDSQPVAWSWRVPWQKHPPQEHLRDGPRRGKSSSDFPVSRVGDSPAVSRWRVLCGGGPVHRGRAQLFLVSTAAELAVPPPPVTTTKERKLSPGIICCRPGAKHPQTLTLLSYNKTQCLL